MLVGFVVLIIITQGKLSVLFLNILFPPQILSNLDVSAFLHWASFEGVKSFNQDKCCKCCIYSKYALSSSLKAKLVSGAGFSNWNKISILQYD